MSYWKYMNRACQGWQEKPWFKFSATCPYWLGHKTLHLTFMHDALFRFYCNNHKGRHGPYLKRGGTHYKHGKLYKLYWKLHPEAKC